MGILECIPGLLAEVRSVITLFSLVAYIKSTRRSYWLWHFIMCSRVGRMSVLCRFFEPYLSTEWSFTLSSPSLSVWILLHTRVTRLVDPTPLCRARPYLWDIALLSHCGHPVRDNASQSITAYYWHTSSLAISLGVITCNHLIISLRETHDRPISMEPLSTFSQHRANKKFAPQVSSTTHTYTGQSKMISLHQSDTVTDWDLQQESLAPEQGLWNENLHRGDSAIHAWPETD